MDIHCNEWHCKIQLISTLGWKTTGLALYPGKNITWFSIYGILQQNVECQQNYMALASLSNGHKSVHPTFLALVFFRHNFDTV